MLPQNRKKGRVCVRVAACFVFMEGSGSEKVEIVSDVVPLRQKLLGFKRISLVLSFLLSVLPCVVLLSWPLCSVLLFR